MLLLPAAAGAAGTGFAGGVPIAPGAAAVASSRDGSTIVVGDSTIGFPGGVGNNVGAFEVLARTGGIWRSTGPIYEQSGGHSFNYFGAAVAISPDGTTVAVGAPGGQDQSGQKSRVEVHSIAIGGDGTPHATRVAVLAPVQPGHFGASVAVTHLASGAPRTVVAVGAPDSSPYDGTNFRFGAGEVYVFTDPVSPVYPGGLGDISGTEVNDFTLADTNFSALGTSVAISPDATTIVAGAPRRGPAFHAGAVDVFTGGPASFAGGQVLAGQVVNGALGTSAAISGDGSTAIAGEPMVDRTGVSGAAHMLALHAPAPSCAGGATLPATVTAADGGHPDEGFGTSVALSYDGTTALIGAPYKGFSPTSPFGSASVPGYAYVEEAMADPAHPAEQLLVPPQVSDNGSHFGQAVTLSGDALTGLVGAPGDTRGTAALYTFGWAFPFTRASRPCPAAAQPGPTPTPTATTTPTAPASGSPAAALAVACSGRSLTLLDVVQRNGRVALLGAANASLIGRSVRILFEDKATVARAVVGSDGFFRVTAKLPPKAIRATNRARYVAVSGTQRSLDLKLTRRVHLSPPTAKGGTVTLTGVVTRPLAAPRAQIIVRQQVTCGTSAIVARVRPRPNGSFRITVPAPAGAKAAIYRLATQVRKTRADTRLSPTFSLPQVVGLTT